MQVGLNSEASSRFYFDNNATTFPSQKLRERWLDLLDIAGNPSSIHQDGRKPKTILRDVRAKLAAKLKCSPLELVFNSGASEGNTSILRSVFASFKNTKNEFLISSVEHPSVIKAAQYVRQNGGIIHFIPVNREGQIDLNFIKEKLSSKTALVSVMYANNETGTLFPIKEITQLAHQAGALMHTDCVQMFGKVNETDFASLEVDYASFSAHKFYALKGTGFCYVKSTAPWEPLVFGSQERARRGGTENITGLAALNIVLDEFEDINIKIENMLTLRNYFETEMQKRIDGVSITAAGSPRIPNTSSVMIKGVDGDTLLMSLDLKGFSVSTGAACSSGSPEPSPVLMAMGFSREEAQSSLRISMGWSSKKEEVEQLVKSIEEVVLKLRNLNSKLNGVMR
jgi:cysteine desulfurase